ncbi:uncharacterized protein LOC134273939 [Saccostrea cucullata]|uniref:uncharacterized protein LOC134232868 n=1 Tax=Saccostrea cuccullata TaxID=36930 RepID=UPI002ED59C59
MSPFGFFICFCHLCFLSVFCKKTNKQNVDILEDDPENANKVIPFPESFTRLVNEHIRDSLNALSVQEASRYTIDCSNYVTDKIISNFRQSKFRWVHNGMRLSTDRGRIVHKKGELTFRKILLKDGGTYLCQIEYQPYLVKTVGVYSLMVKPLRPRPRIVKYGKRFCVQCNSAGIGHAYLYTKRNWIINNSYTVFPNGIPATSIFEDCVDFALPKMTGFWKCVTSQEYSTREWTTAYFQIQVTREPSFLGKIENFMKDNWIHFLLIFLGIGLFLVSFLVAKFKKGVFLKGESAEKTPLAITEEEPQPENEPLTAENNSENEMYFDEQEN